MKKLIIYSVALIFAVSSCDLLENQEPQQSLPQSSVLNTTASLQQALIGAYDEMSDADLAGANFTMFGDIPTTNIDFVGSFPSMQEVQQHNMTSNNAEVEELYEDAYICINACNLILEAVDVVDDAEIAANRDRIKGEALFIRSVIYFEVTRLIGRPYGASASSDLAMPIVLTGVDDVTEVGFESRNTVAEVYNQVISDLTMAAGLLPATNANGRATSGAANGYLAKVAFQMQDYSNALSHANNVINSGQYALNSTVTAYFASEFSGESIFEIAHTAQDNPGVNGAITTFYSVNARNDVNVNADFFTTGADLIVTAAQDAVVTGAGNTWVDTRIRDLMSNNNTRSEKYESFINVDDNAPLLRYAEILLIAAESLVRTTNTIDATAISYLNMIRGRALEVQDGGGNVVSNAALMYTVADFATVQDLLDAIFVERRVELAFEGNYFHDLNRLGMLVDGIPSGSDNLVFPIAQEAIDNNPSLTQNPGY